LFRHPERGGHVTVPHLKKRSGSGSHSNDLQTGRITKMTLRYPIAIEPVTDTTAFGVVVPELPGCFSAGDTLDKAIASAKEAAAASINATLVAVEAISAPTTLENLRANPEFAGWTYRVITIDPAFSADAACISSIAPPSDA
jgi:predicted RNase H-like HicB family nuclease